MKLLSAKPPTPEQLRIIGDTRPGIEIVRGAAGSGKTMTALLRLKNLSDMFAARHTRMSIAEPVRVLVLTYNRTLKGYVERLANEQATVRPGVLVEVDTFAHWASSKVGDPLIATERQAVLASSAASMKLTLPLEFVVREVEYVLGRFPPEALARYLDVERTGRGASPRMERADRIILLELIERYKRELLRRGLLDWEDLSALVARIDPLQYEIAIVDEAQDFSANQLRAINHHLAAVSAFTLVLDTIQRLYPRGYTWTELELSTTRPRFHTLQQNHRNTIEIAQFARGILKGVPVDDDGALPDLSRAARHGPIPRVLAGLYSAQVKYAIRFIVEQVDPSSDSVAFLHPGWFDYLKGQLRQQGLGYAEITREKEWPSGPANIALSTMHSAKGLEFDHVFILGLNANVTRHGHGDQDDELMTLRRLLGMAVARARETVMLGYKPSEASDLIRYLHEGTFNEIAV